MTRQQVVGLCVMLIAVRFVWQTWVNPEVPVVDRIFGAGGVELLKSADRVEIYRLKHLTSESGVVPKLISEYEAAYGPEPLSEFNAQCFANWLSDRAAYRPGNWRAGDFDPEVRIDFVRDNDAVQVVLSFNTNFLYAYRNGHRVGGENFENVRPALVRLLKTLFENDEDIQSLTEHIEPIARP